MTGLTIGQVVFSKCGRDKGFAFIVLKVEGEYAYLADGGLRPLKRPKKKKAKHIQPTNHICEDIKQAVDGCRYLKDADLRKALAGYQFNG